MSNELATIQPARPNDRTMALRATPSDQLPAVLDEIHERALIIRRRIKEEMQQGVHYGFPPGVKCNDPDPTRWTSKPSLYQAGADAVIHWESVIPEFEECEAAWRMLGSIPGKLILKCKLRSSITEKVLGEGLGAAHIQEKADDFNLNKGVKMAQKRSKVSAVLNTYSLGDLFTQDLEDRPRETPDAPSQDADAPKAQPRGERVTVANLKQLYQAWRLHFEHDDTPEAKALFLSWQEPATGIPMDVAHKPEHWTTLKVSECYGRLGNA